MRRYPRPSKQQAGAPVMGASGGYPLLLALAVWLSVRDQPEARGFEQATRRWLPKGRRAVQHLGGRGTVVRSRNIVLLFFAAGAPAVLHLCRALGRAVSDHALRHDARRGGGAGLSIMILAWALGKHRVFGRPDRIGKRKSLFVAGLAVAMLLWPRWFTAALAVACLGIADGFESVFWRLLIITFAFSMELVRSHLAGTVSGIANMADPWARCSCNCWRGVLLDASWSGAMQNGVRIFELSAYQRAFSGVLIWGVIALLLLAFTRETHCKQQDRLSSVHPSRCAGTSSSTANRQHHRSPSPTPATAPSATARATAHPRPAR